MSNEVIRLDNNSKVFVDAINSLRKISLLDINDTIELHINFLSKTKNELNSIKGSILFPNRINKKNVLGVFEDSYVSENKNIISGIKNILTQIKENKIKFNLLFTTPKNLPLLLEYGKILGPKGLIPSKKNNTLTDNISESVNEYLNGRIEIKPDKLGNIHIVLGTLQDSNKVLETNFNNLISKIKELCVGQKTNLWVKHIYVCSTMSKSIKIKI